MENQGQPTNPAYPSELKNLEDGLLRKRRGSEDIGNTIGFGLSGGGIRSATFCLGIFQGLAKQELPREKSADAAKTLLSKIDFLSTVSGGGFFGSFYGRLFTRDEVTNLADVADILTVRAAGEEDRGDANTTKLPEGKVFRWLRENGSYLAPNGGGERLLYGTAVVRNLVAVQVVLAAFVLMIFLFLQLLRGGIEVIAAQDGLFGALWSSYQNLLVRALPWGKNFVWWSPYALLPILAFLLLAVPPLWSYWLVEKPSRSSSTGNWIRPIWGILAVIVFSLAGVVLGIQHDHEWMPFVYLLLLFLAVETLVWALFSGSRDFAKPLDGTETIDDGISANENLRLRLSKRLKNALVFIGVLMAFVVIDSLAQTIYAAEVLGQPLVYLATVVFAPLIGLSGFAWRVFPALGDRADGKSFGVPRKLVSGIAAIVISALLLVTLDVASYAIAWKLAMPTGPHPNWTVTHKLIDAEQLAVTPKTEGGWTIASQPTPSPTPIPGFEAQATPSPTPIPGFEAQATSSTQSAPKDRSRARFNDLRTPAFAFLMAVVMSFTFGWSWPFLNRSIYTSRLIRAYLGASNPLRLKSSDTNVTQAIPGDDIPQGDYWPRHGWLKSKASAESIELAEEEFFEKGAPLHLINVTINETLDAQSQLEQQGREGIGMAVGPAAISAGVAHHLVLAGPPNDSPSATPFRVYPGKGEGYCIFRYPGMFNGELLSLGNWMGISGAAFSTSLESRTSLGLRILAGLANVRLGYWWNSGVEPLELSLNKQSMYDMARKMVAPLSKARDRQAPAPGKNAPLPPDPMTRGQRWSSTIFQLVFTVQSFLFDELFARFHGTARQWWPLSDGGHFENMGGYELIRRRLNVIVIIDAEADPDYTFQGMANLVRKARLDFGAEIKFLTDDELDKRVHPGVRKYFGTLEQLRRWIWIDEPGEDSSASDAEAPNITASKRKRVSIKPVDETSLSLAHAALASVIYSDEHPRDGSRSPIKHWLLYIKPTLVGDEPVDVRQYHTEHPSFPNETTAEQFFDEAQWESYRRLGEHIADKVFRSRDDNGNLLTPEADKFFPYRFGT